MESTNAIARITDQPGLDVVAKPLSDLVRRAYESAGAAGQQAKNALHGVWLGHPLHPVLTDIPLGAWTAALVLDADAVARHDPGLERAADVAIGVGLAGAIASAITGLTDWSETSGRARRTGLVHGLMNIAATTLYAAAYVLRRTGDRAAGRKYAIAGYGIAVSAAYLGGDLVYDQRIGVTHAAVEEPETFTRVADSTEVADGAMARARTEVVDALVVRQHGRLCALAHPCAHLGGPLSEGQLKDGSVVCPWHGSEFRLDDGRVINGPSTHDQPTFDVRERDGRIEVKTR